MAARRWAMRWSPCNAPGMMQCGITALTGPVSLPGRTVPSQPLRLELIGVMLSAPAALVKLTGAGIH